MSKTVAEFNDVEKIDSLVVFVEKVNATKLHVNSNVEWVVCGVKTTAMAISNENGNNEKLCSIFNVK